jgi:hypothetical protein
VEAAGFAANLHQEIGGRLVGKIRDPLRKMDEMVSLVWNVAQER